MRKFMAILVIIGLLVPALALAEEKTFWATGGEVTNVKDYGPDEVRGYLIRIDMKTLKGKEKKIYVDANTAIKDKDGNKMKAKDIKVGASVTINYKLHGENFLAYDITIK